MVIQGAGGTGKSKLIDEISATFEEYEATALLAETATTGIASSLIGGQTVHSWASVPRNNPGKGDWLARSGADAKMRQAVNIKGKRYLIIDEYSMATKMLVTIMSEIIGEQMCGEGYDTFTSFLRYRTRRKLCIMKGEATREMNSSMWLLSSWNKCR